MYQSPGLIYETIQITLPISPEQCIFLNRQGIKGYLPIKQIMVDDINRRTRFHAEEHFVIRKNEKRDIWFDPGIEPEDSWEKEHQKSTEEIEEGLKKTWDILEKMATIIPRNQT